MKFVFRELQYLHLFGISDNILLCSHLCTLPYSAERTIIYGTWYLFYDCFRGSIDGSHLDML